MLLLSSSDIICYVISATLWSIPNTCPQSRCELHSVGVVAVKFNLYNDPWLSGEKPWRHNLNLTTAIRSNLWWMSALHTLVVRTGLEAVLEIKAYYKCLIIFSGRVKVSVVTLSTVFCIGCIVALHDSLLFYVHVTVHRNKFLYNKTN